MVRMATVLNKLLAVQGLWVRDLRVRLKERAVWIEVTPRWRVSRCGSCGRKVRRRHDRAWRSWRHLDVFGWRSYLRYAIWRVRCPRCGVRTEAVPWAAAGSRFTRDFEHQVAWLAQRSDLSAVAEYCRISWATVRGAVKRVVEQAWDGESALDGLRVIGIDEISYRRHHHYLTVVVDHLSGRVVWSGKGRKVKTLLRFFRQLGPERTAQLEAISVDMWEPYLIVLRKKAPQARVIFDRFHIVRHLNEALTKVRQQLIRDADPQTRRDLKNTRFPVLKRPGNRTPKDRQVLEEQVRGNRKLYRAMLLKDDFMDLYSYRREGWAKRFLKGWLHRAMASKLEPIKKVARMIRNHLDGVLRPMADQQRTPRRHEQPNPPAQPSQLWAPLCGGVDLTRLPLLQRPTARKLPRKVKESPPPYRCTLRRKVWRGTKSTTCENTVRPSFISHPPVRSSILRQKAGHGCPLNSATASAWPAAGLPR